MVEPDVHAVRSPLDTLKRETRRLAKLILAPDGLLPTWGISRDGGHPHIEHDERGFHLVVVERGSEQQRRTTLDGDQVLYWIFEMITSSMAFEHELRYREPGRDPRRIAFPRQVELLTRLNPQWARRRQREIEMTLETYPFDDDAIHRLDRLKQVD